MDWAYFDRMEIEDFEKLKEVNNDLKWFTKMERNTLFDRIDIEANDRKRRRVNIELKTRIIPIDKYDTIYIEEDKYKHLMMKWENDGEIPLYINFFNGGIVGVWDLRKFPNPELKNVTIINKGRQTIENVNRYILPVEGCIKLCRGEECRYCIMRGNRDKG